MSWSKEQALDTTKGGICDGCHQILGTQQETAQTDEAVAQVSRVLGKGTQTSLARFRKPMSQMGSGQWTSTEGLLVSAVIILCQPEGRMLLASWAGGQRVCRGENNPTAEPSGPGDQGC